MIRGVKKWSLSVDEWLSEKSHGEQLTHIIAKDEGQCEGDLAVEIRALVDDQGRIFVYATEVGHKMTENAPSVPESVKTRS